MKVNKIASGGNLSNKKKNALPNTSKLLKPKRFKSSAKIVHNKIGSAKFQLSLTESGMPSNKKFNLNSKQINLKLSSQSDLEPSEKRKSSHSRPRSEKIPSQSLEMSLNKHNKTKQSAPKDEFKLSKGIPNHKEPSKTILKRRKNRNSRRKLGTSSSDVQSTKTGSRKMEQDSFINKSKLISGKVSSAVAGLLKLLQEKSNNKAGLLDLEEPIFMQVECIKIPICPTKQLRLKLPHPLVNELSDILLITADKKGSKIYPEKAIEHYTELLAKHNIDFIQKVIPMKMLREEYSQYEMRRKLVDQFDVILADSKITKCLPARLGKFICYKRKMPITVHLNRNNLKEHLESALKKTQMTIKSAGPVSVVQVGHTKMTDREVTANILAVSKELEDMFPGGWKNIRSLNIKTANGPSLPVYLSLLSPNMVRIPVEQKEKQQEVEGELSTMPGANVVVRSDGTVYLKKLKDEKPVDDELDDEILAEAEKYMQASKTIRFDDSDDENNEKKADALTAAVEKEFLSDYNETTKAKKSGDKDVEEDEEEEESSDEEETVIPTPSKKRKKESGSKKQVGKSPNKKQKIGQQQDKSKNKGQSPGEGAAGIKGINKKRGARGGKKNKMNKDQRKAMIKRKKAGKK